ncbi:hypothetical protein Plhal304r1_c005g0021971 [Plasmopara halstedii]
MQKTCRDSCSYQSQSKGLLSFTGHLIRYSLNCTYPMTVESLSPPKDDPREVIVDDSVTNLWTKLTASTFEIGLLVGQISLSNAGDFVLAAVPVPSESEGGEPPNSLGDVSVDWVQEIAQHVNCLLPGGIRVVGIYVVSVLDISKQAVQYLRAIAEAVALSFNIPACDNVHYLAHVSLDDNFCIHSVYSVEDVQKTQLKPAKLKKSPGHLRFEQYRTLVEVDEPISFTSNASRTAIKVPNNRIDEVEEQLEILFRRVADSIAVHKLTDDANIHYMNLLTLKSSNPQKDLKNPLGSIRGTVSCVAFVLQSESKPSEVAAVYLKRDFVKSLSMRVALARESLNEDDDAGRISIFEKGGVIRLAQRGLVPWPLKPYFMATVHVLSDENAAKATENALEILGGVRNGDARNGDACAWVALETSGQLRSSQDLTLSKKSEQSNFVYFMLPLILVLLLIAYQHLA